MYRMYCYTQKNELHDVQDALTAVVLVLDAQCARCHCMVVSTSILHMHGVHDIQVYKVYNCIRCHCTGRGCVLVLDVHDAKHCCTCSSVSD